jgi:Predicted periplasmic or secreted lipoprotein
MAKLPLLSGARAVKAFTRVGWTIARQTGSHLIMVRQGSMVTLSVPMHSEIDRGTLRKLISLAGLSVEEFLKLL